MNTKPAVRLATEDSTAARRVTIPDRAEALNRVRSLLPRIRARSTRTEADRRVPDETVKELLQQGLFGLVTPRVFGGSELGFGSLVEVTTEIAAACGSTGWVFGVLAGHSWLLNLFPPDAQSEILSDPRALISTVFRLGGTVTRVDGGYRLVGGEGRFCSGIDFAQWVIVGNSVTLADGSTEPQFFVVPRSDVEVIDDWYTAGMRGTGSRSIRIADAFIPEHRSVPLKDMVSGNGAGAQFHSSPLYRMPFQIVAPFSIIGAPMGMARGAIQLFVDGLKSRLVSMSALEAAEQSPTLVRIGEAMADIDAAYALVMEDAGRIDRARDPSEVPALDRARVARDWAYAAQKARYAVSAIFEVAGGSGIYNSSELQRMWRDVNSAAQHVAFGWDGAMANFGRASVGVEPISFAAKRR